MRWTYNTSILLYGLAIRFFALFNSKARKFVNGRKHVFEDIAQRIDPSKRPVWFHFASLGEFEQGREVMEQFKKTHPGKELVITFFSPSGYEIRKNYALAKGVFYLPLDTQANARRFVELVQPEMAFFTKYEFWYHYFRTLKKNQIPLYLISGIFRKDQVFFKWYGEFYRDILHCVTYFFVQNKESEILLREIKIDNVAVTGDTRFDRVAENAANPKQVLPVEAFCAEASVIVCGSTWPEDEKLLAALPGSYPDWKLIIAPHEIGDIRRIITMFPQAIRFSELGSLAAAEVNSARVLVIDNIGMLSSLYQYGKIAYIGGGFGAGIHNILEAAAFGLPVIFGPKYHKFQEAKDMIGLGAAISIANKAELIVAFERFENKDASAIAKKYVSDNAGATKKILAKVSGD